MKKIWESNKIAIVGAGIGVGFLLVLAYAPIFKPLEYTRSDTPEDIKGVSAEEPEKEKISIPSHVPTPEPLKAIYMTSWVAGTLDWRNRLVKLIEETELNAIVIDIKDYTGRISFEVEDPLLVKYEAVEKRIPDIKDFIEELHKKNIYVIGRISVFQDPHLVKARPDLAVKRASDGAVWKDYKGISWLDAGSKEVWDYILALAKESHAIGFDEINFDYIRFPSDGNMKDISFPFSNGKAKPDVIKSFFAHVHKEMEKTGAVTSADLFGMTTTNTDDLNIGQLFENALPYFDYIAPMTYPSHYPAGFNGHKDPNKAPYEIVKFAIDAAVLRAKNASTSPLKIRPWVQDFDYPVDYTAADVLAQEKAIYDAGLTSWMLWDPANRYTREALAPAP